MANIMANIYRTQNYESVIRFCVGLFDFILNNNRLTDFTNSFLSRNLKKK